MGTVNLGKQIGELEQFLNSTEHLKIVINNFQDITKVDRNDLYELVYSKKSIEKWLEQDIENNDVKNRLNDLLSSINILLEALPEKSLQEIVDRKLQNTKDIEEINKKKYGNKKQYRGLEDKSKVISQKRKSILAEYFSKRIVALLFITIIYFLTVSGGVKDISDKVSHTTFAVLTTVLGDTNESSEIKDEVDIVESSSDTDDLIEALNTFEPEASVEKLDNIFSMLLQLVMMLIVMVTFLGMMLDLIYLMFPPFVELLDNKVSESVKQLRRLNAYEPVQSVHEVIDYRDKFEVARALLNNTITYLEDMSRFNTLYNVDKKETKRVDKAIQELMCKLIAIKGDITSSNIMTKVEALVNAELIYIENKEAIDKNASDPDLYKKGNKLSKHILSI